MKIQVMMFWVVSLWSGVVKTSKFRSNLLPQSSGWMGT